MIQGEFGRFVQTVDRDNLPRTTAKQAEFQSFLIRWVETRRRFEDATKKDEADPRLKPLRDKYIEADDLYTYAFGEYFAGLDPTKTTAARKRHFGDAASGYENGTKALSEAHAMAERLMK